MDKEFFKDGKLNKAIEKYPSLRNELLGHGYSFEDSIESSITAIQSLYESVLSANVPALNSDIDIIHVMSLEGDYYKGINYKSDGNTF